jgi:hypothetical protein
MDQPRELRIVAVNGMLGYGFEAASLRAGVAERPHLVGGDSGSSDPGPFYLGSGTSLVKPEQLRRDLGLALAGARDAGAPLVIGSAAMGGGAPHLALLKEILHGLAREQGLHFRLATIHAEIPRETVRDALRAGRIAPMADAPELEEAAVMESARVVGQMGTEPFAAALARGADVVLAGRSCDTAIYAALPVAEGFDPGLALHMAKIMECGAQCAMPLAANDSLARRDPPGPFPRPAAAPGARLHPGFRRRPLPVRAGQPDLALRAGGRGGPARGRVRAAGPPDRARQRLPLHPGGAAAHQARGRAPRRLPRLRPGGRPRRRGDREPQRDRAQVRAAVRRNLPGAVRDDQFALGFRHYGRDAVLGPLEWDRTPPREVGTLIEVVAETQALADAVLSLARSSFLHCPFPGRKTTAGNLAFPFSPSDASAGEVYEFSVYHLMEVEDQLALFPIEMERI